MERELLQPHQSDGPTSCGRRWKTWSEPLGGYMAESTFRCRHYRGSASLTRSGSRRSRKTRRAATHRGRRRTGLAGMSHGGPSLQECRSGGSSGWRVSATSLAGSARAQELPVVQRAASQPVLSAVDLRFSSGQFEVIPVIHRVRNKDNKPPYYVPSARSMRRRSNKRPSRPPSGSAASPFTATTEQERG